MRFLSVLLIAALAACANAFTPASQYHLQATMKLPYAEIAEPVAVWYDSVNGNQRVEYYWGMDVYVNRMDVDMTYQLNPVYSQQQCFATNGSASLSSYFPDLTKFFKQPAVVQINFIDCYQYVFLSSVGPVLSTYNFFVSVAEDRPIRYEMIGYDSLLGSHYDHYVLDYDYYTPMTFAPNDPHFAKPAAFCGDFPGPGFTTPLPSIPTPDSDSSSDIEGHFSDFSKAHDKQYATENERRERLNTFRSNKMFIEHSNHKHRVHGRSLRLAINKFADFSEAEMNLYRGITSRKAQNPRIKSESIAQAKAEATAIHPEPLTKISDNASLDWRTKGAVNPPKDQGICGSCWSFGTVGTLEGTYYLATGNLLKFSEQELVDCAWNQGSNACDGGEDFRAYKWIMGNGGLAETVNYGPYLMADGWCHSNNTQNTIVLSGFTFVTPNNEQALLDAVTNHGPISVAIDASLKSFTFYHSGVYSDSSCKNDPDSLDHAVLVVGYGIDSQSGQTYWIVKNSWSDMWGDNGYVYMARANNLCGVETAPTYATLKM